MIKNVIGAVIGSELAKNTKVDNTTGAATGAIAGTILPMVLRRVSLPTMLAIGAGGYFLNKYRKENKPGDTQDGRETLTAAEPVSTPVAPDVTGVPATA